MYTPIMVMVAAVVVPMIVTNVVSIDRMRFHMDMKKITSSGIETLGWMEYKDMEDSVINNVVVI